MGTYTLPHKHRKRPGRHSKKLNKRIQIEKKIEARELVNLSVRKNFSREI